jgi:hypothetical protein
LLEFKFIASGGSTLAVDSFLGGPGSISDTFTVNGDISGQTKVKVNDTNSGPGVFNSAGIPVVFANSNVKGHAFFLANPIESMIAPRVLDASIATFERSFDAAGAGRNSIQPQNHRHRPAECKFRIRPGHELGGRQEAYRYRGVAVAILTGLLGGMHAFSGT